MRRGGLVFLRTEGARCPQTGFIESNTKLEVRKTSSSTSHRITTHKEYTDTPIANLPV
jgi:hypothetical protein